MKQKSVDKSHRIHGTINLIQSSQKRHTTKQHINFFNPLHQPPCPCGGGCPRCAPIQPKIRVGEPNDEYEKEADRVAEQIIRMPEPVLQRKSPREGDESCREDEKESEQAALLRKPFSVGVRNSFVPPIVHEVLQSPGQPLDMQTREFFEPRFGYDFSGVRVHIGEKAQESARAIGALAYTSGKDMVIGENTMASGSTGERSFIAHELAHVVQQGKNPVLGEKNQDRDPAIPKEEHGFAKGTVTPIQNYDNRKIFRRRARDEREGRGLKNALDPPEFCKRYQSDEEAKRVSAEMKASLIPFITGIFGTEVGDLWSAYLNRRKGDSLEPRSYESPSSSIVQGFANASETHSRTKELADLIISNLEQARSCPDLPDTEWADVPVEKLLSSQELNSTGPYGDTDSDIDFSTSFSIPGNIAGGVGSSDAGPDTRKVTGNVRLYRIRDEKGNTKKVKMQTDFKFIVKDAVDLCPGQPGSLLEWQFTVPLSRLEKTGYAYDVPYIVKFSGPVVERTLPDFVANCWKNPSKERIPFNFSIKARLPKSRLFYVPSNGSVTVTSKANYDISVLPAEVGFRYYIGILRLGTLFDRDAGNHLFQIGKMESHTWTNLEQGNYYLEIWKDEPGGFSPFLLIGNGFIEVL
ncbi:MAG TPA: DUF4157 domain-containing protein [Methanoregulaceae archaeon]|nr:DUF4157 domain-containing protein [Methanoregulaceae archaeon]